MQNFLRYLPIDKRKTDTPQIDLSNMFNGGDQGESPNRQGLARMFGAEDPNKGVAANAPLPPAPGRDVPNGGFVGTGSMPTPDRERVVPTQEPGAPPAPWNPRMSDPEGGLARMFNIDYAARPQTGDADYGTGSGYQMPEEPAPAPLSPSERTMRQIDELKRTPMKREHSMWKRLGSGLMQGLSAWAQSGGQGGLAGAIGAVATGGAVGASSPGALAKWKRENQINKMWNRLGQEQRGEAGQLGLDMRKAQVDATTQAPILKGQEIARKAAADAQKARYNDALLEDKKRGRDLSETKINDLREYRKQLIDQGAELNKAKIRQIDERLEDYDLDRKSRENIAFGRQSTQQGLAKIMDEAKNAKGKAEAAKRIDQIREGGVKVGASESEIEARIQEYVRNLPEAYRP